jgi:Flp pilus assembly protein TadD
MSNAAWHQQQPELALTYARRAEALVPDYPRITLMKAQAFYDLGEVDEAERSYREAMVLQPDDPVPAFNLGVLTFMDRRDPLKARAFFEQVLQRQPRSVSANAYLAMCLVQARALEDARARMEDIPPAAVEQSLPARVAWISVLQAEGRIDQASAAYRQWIEPLPQPAREEAERLLAAAGAGS